MSEALAKAIYDWFEAAEGWDHRDRPTVYACDREKLTVGVDGVLDCRKLAAAIASTLSPTETPEDGR